jgi:hypothetical protein
MPNVAKVILDGMLKPIHLVLDNGFDRAGLALLYSGMNVSRHTARVKTRRFCT